MPGRIGPVDAERAVAVSSLVESTAGEVRLMGLGLHERKGEASEAWDVIVPSPAAFKAPLKSVLVSVLTSEEPSMGA
ncbi:MAG: hypothetical protein EBS97_08610 [Verrucomicrobia bacterium]|nr:hypothetical protein [Verrucomicrobiota bacterium]